jgi:hypothetical protein
MARHGAYLTPCDQLGKHALVANFFGEPVDPVLASSSSTITNFIAGGEAKQFNVMNLSSTPTPIPYLPEYGLLDSHAVSFATPSRRWMY